MINSHNTNNPEQAVIFLHIPKAAGSTLHKIFEQQYDPNIIFSIDDEKTIADFINLSEAQRAKVRVLKGHMYFGLHRFLPQPSTYITLLRDPIERVISHYYYVLSTPSNELHTTLTSQKISLQDFVLSGMCLELDNGQTRLLSTSGATIDYGNCSTELLESAKKNIKEHFALVGFVERFDETLILLKKAFKWKMPFFYLKQNVTQNRPLKEDIPRETLALIERYNELDIELYKYAQGLFEELINQQNPLYTLQLKILKSLNQFHHKNQKTIHALSIATHSAGFEIINKAANSTISHLNSLASSFAHQSTSSPASVSILGLQDIEEINFKPASKNIPSGFFDTINGAITPKIKVQKPIPLTASGWAIISDESRPADRVIITYGKQNSLVAVAPVNIERLDVVKALNNPNYRKSGWSITLNSSTLPTGKVVLKAWAYNATRKEATQLNYSNSNLQPRHIFPWLK